MCIYVYIHIFAVLLSFCWGVLLAIPLKSFVSQAKLFHIISPIAAYPNYYPHNSHKVVPAPPVMFVGLDSPQ